MNTKLWLKKIFTLRLFAGLVIGGLLGFTYYYFIGCSTGGCAITSNPYRITAYGMLLGGLLLHK